MPPRQPLNAAIVGAGLMGRWHARFARRAGARIAAVVDPNIEAARHLARRWPHAAVFPALESCLDQADVDVVHLCTQTEAHFPLALLAVNRQKHVLVEKPMTASAAEAEQLLAAARAHGVLVNPVHQFPYQRGFERLRLAQNQLGDPVRVAFVCCTAGAGGLPPAEHDRLLVEVLPHPLSLFYALFGDAVFERLRVVTARAGSDVEVGGTVNGVRLAAVVSLRGRPTEASLRYVGTRGSADVNLFHGFHVVEHGRVSRATKLTRPFVQGGTLLLASGLNLGRRALRAEWAYPGLLDLIRLFYGAIRDGMEPPIDAAEIMGTARALDRFRREMRGGGAA